MQSPPPDAHDGSNGADGKLDAQADRRNVPEGSIRCKASDPFISNEIDDEFGSNAVQSGGLTLSDDGLEAYFSANETTDAPETIYRATRKHVSDRFGISETVLTDQGSPLLGGDPALSPNGLSLFYTALGDLNPSTNSRSPHIYLSKRDSRSTAFKEGVSVDGLSTTDSSEGDPFVSRDGKTLYFATDREGDWDIFSIAIDQLGLHSNPVPLSAVNVRAAEEYGPVLSKDNLTIYFSSNRKHDFNLLDIYYATRRFETDGFGAAVHIAELSTTNREYPETMSDDGCTLWYSSGYNNSSAIYAAKKTPR
jgi:Tol biopolymer transport system component